MLILVIGIACAAIAVYLAGEAATVGARERGDAVRRAASAGERRARARTAEPLRERALPPLKEKLARAVLRLNPKANVETVTHKLLAAGLARRVSPMGFLAAKGVMTVLGLLFGLVVGVQVGGVMPLALAALLGGLGFAGPDFVLSSRARTRREHVRSQLPDALDLLAVSVEAGLGFDGAIGS